MSPSYAERARAVAATASGLEVGVLSMTVPVERHLADADGSLLLCAPPTGSGEPGSPLALAGRFPGPVLTATLTDAAAARLALQELVEAASARRDDPRGQPR